MLAPQTLDGLIIKDPQLRGGRPVLAGTGVTVRTVAGHYKLGLTPEEIADEMDLELAGVYAALAYYHLNRDEIEADILANSEEVLMKDPGASSRASAQAGLLLSWGGSSTPKLSSKSCISRKSLSTGV